MAKLGDKSGQAQALAQEAEASSLRIQPVVSNSANEELKSEVESLTQKVEELSDHLNQSRKENQELQDRINELVSEIH